SLCLLCRYYHLQCDVLFHALYSSSLSFLCFFFFTAPSTSEIYTLSLHDALPISGCSQEDGRGGSRAKRGAQTTRARARRGDGQADRKSTRLNSSHVSISYAVFCLKKKKKKNQTTIQQKQTTNIESQVTTHTKHIW